MGVIVADVAVPVAQIVARSAVDLPFVNASGVDDVFVVPNPGGDVYIQIWTSAGPGGRFGTVATVATVDGLAVADRRVSLPGPTVSAPVGPFDPKVYGSTLRIIPDIDADLVHVRAWRFPGGA